MLFFANFSGDFLTALSGEGSSPNEFSSCILISLFLWQTFSSEFAELSGEHKLESRKKTREKFSDSQSFQSLITQP